MKLELETLPEWTENAVLVYGPRKSGTTLLLNLLDGSNELLAFPTETKFKRFFGHIPAGPAALDYYFDQSLIASGDFPNFDRMKYCDGVAEIKTFSVTTLRQIIQLEALAIYDSIIEPPAVSPHMFAMKEVGGDPRQVVGFFRQLYINGKVVMIARQPRYVTRSVFNDRRRKGIRLGFFKLIREAIDPIRVIHHQAEILEKDSSVLLVLYEDLVEDPALQISRIASYLGLSDDEVFRRPTIFGKPVVVKTSSRQVSEVFSDVAKWHDGLTISERLAVLFGEVSMKILGWMLGRSYKDYGYLKLLSNGNRSGSK